MELTEQILLQLIVVLIGTWLFGSLCRRVGQQLVIGEILTGLALGPSFLGLLWPQSQKLLFPASTLPTLQTLGDIGLVLYIFSLGVYLDKHLMRRQSRAAVIISLSSILFPLLSGMVLAFFLFPTLAGPKATLLPFMLLMGTTIAITAFPVLVRLLTEKGLLGSDIGLLALFSAVVDDVTAWCLLTAVIVIIRGGGLLSIVLTVWFILFLILCTRTLVHPLFVWASQHIRSSRALITLLLVTLLLTALGTSALGVQPVLGAFLIGLFLPREVVFIDFSRTLDQVNTRLFLPLFFVFSGLRTQIELISSPGMWLICLLIFMIACIGKIGSVVLVTRFMGKSWRDALSLGILMNTRGLVELIALNLGLNLGILSPTLFTMLVLMTVVTTIIASPLLSLLGYKQNVVYEGSLPD